MSSWVLPLCHEGLYSPPGWSLFDCYSALMSPPNSGGDMTELIPDLTSMVSIFDSSDPQDTSRHVGVLIHLRWFNKGITLHGGSSTSHIPQHRPQWARQDQSSELLSKGLLSGPFCLSSQVEAEQQV